MNSRLEGEGRRLRLEHGLDDNRLTQILGNTKKGRIPYNTGSLKGILTTTCSEAKLNQSRLSKLISLISISEANAAAIREIERDDVNISSESQEYSEKISRKRNSYGIRNFEDDGEYHDAADRVAIATESPVHTHVKRLLEEYNKKRIAKVEASLAAKLLDWKTFEEEQEHKMRERQLISDKYIDEKRKLLNIKYELRKKDIERELEEKKRIDKLETELLDKAFTSQKESLENEKRKKLEVEEAERKKLEEDRQRLIIQEKVAKEKEQAVLEAELKKREENERLARERLDQQKKLVQESVQLTPKLSSSVLDSRLPKELRECIFFSDLTKYGKTQELLDSIQDKTKHINNSSSFYKGAIKVVNTPLNQISVETQTKVNHFTNLLEGKIVHAAGLSTPFSINQEQNGDLFVMNLLAFRFVKKADAESSENKEKRKNLNYLATIGVKLINRFPMWGELVQAHFYKICPFLVPFNYPRRGMDIRSYGTAIGHHMSPGDDKEATEATLTQTLLDKLSGYCMLYGFMIRNLHSYPAEKVDEFFTTSEAWRILSKIVSLEPQEEVTATILHALLEILNDLLSRSYGLQYKKLLKHIKTVYLEKIRIVTSKGKSGSMTRLELYLDTLGV